MKLAYHAPLPPADTGVAQYAAALLVPLSKRFEIDANATNALYQIGNNGLHWDIYQRALAQPGVVLLHDACLHHLLLGHLDRTAYIEEFVYNYGEWFRQTAERYWERRSASAADPRYFERPLLKRLCERALLVIVHNPAAAKAVRDHVPTAQIRCIPHFFQAPRPHSYREVDEYREEVLGLEPGEILFAVLGHLRESKRLDAVLTAFARLRRQGLPIKLLVQGRFVGPDLEAALRLRLSEDGVLRRDFLDEAEWWLQAHAIDVCVNLRWPLAGESSGIATRLMGIGKPVILTRSLETEEIPEVAALKVDPGIAEQEQLEHFMAWLAIQHDARRSIGRHAAIHTQSFHAIDLAARQLGDCLETAFDGKPTTTLP